MTTKRARVRLQQAAWNHVPFSGMYVDYEVEPGPVGPGGLFSSVQNVLGTSIADAPILRFEGLDVEKVSDPDGDYIRVSPQKRNPLVSVRYTATGNVNLVNAGSTMDGRGLLLKDRVVLRLQSNAAENGVYWVSQLAPTILTRITTLDQLVNYRVRIREGATQATKQFLKTGTSFLEYPDLGDSFYHVDIDDFYLDSDGDDVLAAFERMHDALDVAGVCTFYRRGEYRFSSTLILKKKITLRGVATLNLGNGTRFMFEGSSGIRSVFALDPAFPDAIGGWSQFENLWLDYTGSNLEDEDFHGIIVETPIIAWNLTISNFPGHAYHSIADLNLVPPAGANLNRIYNIRCYFSGLSGIYLAGDNANASTFVGFDVTGCGRRFKDVVRAEYVLRATNSTGADWTVTPGQHVFSDTRYGLYYIAKTGGVVPSGGGMLDFTVMSYDRSLEAQGVGLGSGTQYGYGTEYNQPAANTITNVVYSNPAWPGGVTVTNQSGVPSVLATLGDAHGVWDNAFLGNCFLGGHATFSGVRHYLSVKTGGSSFEGCYCEIGNFGEVSAPNVHNGGLWADPPGMPSAGFQRNTSALAITDLIFLTHGALGVTIRLARRKTDEFAHLFTTADPSGYKLQPGLGPLANTYALLHAGSASLGAIGFTSPAHARGAGHTVVARGIINGTERSFTGAAPPAQSTATSVVERGDIFRVNPLPASGQPWEYLCTAKDGGGNLTWTLLRSVP